MDKDKREVDFLIVTDDKLFPIEVKKSARVNRAATPFAPLKRLKRQVDHGAVICLYPQVLPMSETYTSVPVGII